MLSRVDIPRDGRDWAKKRLFSPHPQGCLSPLSSVNFEVDKQAPLPLLPQRLLCGYLLLMAQPPATPAFYLNNQPVPIFKTGPSVSTFTLTNTVTLLLCLGKYLSHVIEGEGGGGGWRV